MDSAPEKFCPEKGCGKKMAAFRQGTGWKYICPDAGKHAAAKVERAGRGGARGRGGWRKGRPSPMKGKKRKRRR